MMGLIRYIGFPFYVHVGLHEYIVWMTMLCSFHLTGTIKGYEQGVKFSHHGPIPVTFVPT